MIELSTHIEYLLFNHNDVSVPQLGTFIVMNMRSKRVEEEGLFLPPYRSVTFHWDEQETGEEFITSLSKLHNLQINEARIMCTEYVDELLQTLSEEGSVAIGSMGYLLRDAQSNQLSFVPQQSGIESPAYYGLDAVPFKKLSNDVRLHREKTQAVRGTKVTSLDSDSDIITIRINRRIFNYITTIAASIILFFTFTSPFGNPITETSNRKAETEFLLTPKTIVPVAKEKVVPKHVVSEAKAVADVKAEDPIVGITKETDIAHKAIAKAEPVTDQESVSGDYAIVVASAISKKNAVWLADKLQKQGYDAMACQVGGMVRVLIPGFSSMDDAYEEIRRMRKASDEFSGLWPYRVKGQMIQIN